MVYKVKLTEKQRKELIEVVRNGKQQAKVIMHANIDQISSVTVYNTLKKMNLSLG